MHVTVVDLGSLRCRALCMGIENDGPYKLLGFVNIPSRGVIQGEISNSEEAFNTLEEALQLLEEQMQLPKDFRERDELKELSFVFSGVTLGYENSWGTTGITPIRRSSNPRDSSARLVTKEDIQRALESAVELKIRPDFERLHELPRCYLVDGERVDEGITGRNGIRLDVQVHIITCLGEAIQSLIDVGSFKSYRPREIVHSTVAASYISLAQEELEEGCLLIDIGYGNCSFQYSLERQPLITESIGIGGYHVTNDIAQIFEIPFDIAEQLKLEHGVCWPPFATEDQQIVIPGGASTMAHEVSLYELCEILNARLEELLELVYGRLECNGIGRQHIQSVVLVGGGSLLLGLGELAEEVFECPARLGLPDHPEIEESDFQDWVSPQNTALFGLAMYRITSEQDEQQEAPPPAVEESTLASKVIDWLKRNFG